MLGDEGFADVEDDGGEAGGVDAAVVGVVAQDGLGEGAAAGGEDAVEEGLDDGGVAAWMARAGIRGPAETLLRRLTYGRR
ncbi:hypothetical protein GCM10010403_36010 [Glycomyces rutgersensis]|uniref:Uncharacterized protein n=1 Tax=Glycomyces rutgersensis TaxID=58115 RepID=A0ABN3FY79_9ACTN